MEVIIGAAVIALGIVLAAVLYGRSRSGSRAERPAAPATCGRAVGGGRHRERPAGRARRAR
jgi:hypothetical protein